MHCDTVSRLFSLSKEGKIGNLRNNSCHVDLQRMKRAGCLIQNFALFADQKQVKNITEYIFQLMSFYQNELQKNKKRIKPMYCYEDFLRNQKNGRMSALLTLEGGAALKGKIELLHDFYHQGVRMMTLTWNYPNELGFPNQKGYEQKGLTRKGLEMVREMESLGVLIDVSHLSDGGFWDVVKNTQVPFVASHSNSRMLVGVPRNLTDVMIHQIGERGGVIGLNFCTDFLQITSDQRKIGNIESLIKHARHMMNEGGEEVLGLGSDFDGILDNPEIFGVEELEKVREKFLSGGFSNSQVDKIFYDNVLRVYREVL